MKYASRGPITMTLNIPGVVTVVLFYILILGTGVWAARKSRRAEGKSHGDRTAVVLLGDRNISLVVGIFTMTGMLVCAAQKCCQWNVAVVKRCWKLAAVVTLILLSQHKVHNLIILE